MRTIAALLVLCACGAPAAPMSLCDAGRCDPSPREFAPAPALEGATHQALVRLERATGLELTIDADGLPLAIDDRVPPEFCGETVQHLDAFGVKAPQRIEIRRATSAECGSIVGSVLHELIHAIAPQSEHAATGVFSEFRAETNDLLDAASLEALCSQVPCERETPEGAD